MRVRTLPIRFLLFSAAAAVAVIAGLDFKADAQARDLRERLKRHRNVGKAFYETTSGSQRAVEEFEQAVKLAPDSTIDRLNLGLALLRADRIEQAVEELQRVQKADPNLPHTWFNLGLLFRKQGRVNEAIRQLEQFTKLVPDDPIAHYNLGVLYDRDGRPDLALREFHTAARLDDRFVAPLFQIYTQHRVAGREEQAQKALAVFRRAKERQEQYGESEDIEWNDYAEIYEVIEPLSLQAGKPDFKLRDIRLPGRLEPGSAGLLVTDVNADGKPELVAWSHDGLRVYRSGQSALEGTGLESLRAVVAMDAGDFDNDGLLDLAVVTDSSAAVFRNERGRFQRIAAAFPADRFRQALWIDYDHDTDLDLLLFGDKGALFRNNGEGGFEARSGDFPFAGGRPLSVALIRTMSDTKGVDVVASYEDRPGVLYRDRLRGRFQAIIVDAIPAGARSLVVLDANNDGWMDVAFAHPKNTGIVLNRRGALHSSRTEGAGSSAVAAVDFENRGWLDLVSSGALLRNQGSAGFRAMPAPAPLRNGLAWAAADFNGDGRSDVAKVADDGSVHLLVNDTARIGKWVSITLAGVKTTKLAQGSEIEIKAGGLYQKRLYAGMPVLFGVRSETEIDTVRITWPHGMIQNEVRQPTDQSLTHKEAPRLSGSCPMVFTWNGREFQFITDVLGVAPLGASSGDGDFFPVDHDEYVQIPESALVENQDGFLEVRVTEELREVAYLDKIQLIAVDHPAQIDVFTNDKFKSPPFPEFRLFAVRDRVYPVRAADSHGHDLLPVLLRKDQRYPDDFARNHAGVAETHTLDLDFGSGAAIKGRALLILSGWTDWADGSTFLAAGQRPSGGLTLPYLQVKDRSGVWRTVVADMGLPAGKPKTIVVDLTGKFLSSSREVRIVTNLCLYWDEIFLSQDGDAGHIRTSPVDVHDATLRFRGFSRPLIHPERKQPEVFDYSHVSPVSSWNPTPGLYTKYGNVAELVSSVDDRYVIMGSGDELRLLFDGKSLGAPAPGWRREFLLFVDGWAKDGDANTAFGNSTGPLPFHGMSSYPYSSSETYPSSAVHDQYRAMWNTRKSTRLIGQLRPR